MDGYNNMLKLNDDKIELFVFSPQRQADAFKGLNINIRNVSVTSKIGNLSMIFDQMRNISSIRSTSTFLIIKILSCSSHITSGLVSALLYGLPVKTFNVLRLGNIVWLG